MRQMFCTVMVGIGSMLSYFVGGVDTMFIVLCVFLMVDYISGVITALVFHKSPKTETGKVNSTVSFKGLCKKLFMIALVGVAHLLDVTLETDFLRGGVIVAFITNETISIVENAGLMGVPIPSVITKAIDILNERE